MKPVAVAYLGSHFLSLLGNGIIAIALPLAVLQITGSPLSMGVIATATSIPAVIIGLLAGVVIDRVNRRNASAIADLISAASVAALPIVDAVTGLNLAWFVLLGIVGAVGDVPGSTAREVLVASVAQHSGVGLERLVGIRQTLTSTALVIGPALAGTLVALLGSTTVFYVTAATSAAAAGLTLLLPRRVGVVADTAATEGPVLSPWRQVLGGVAILRRSRFLMATIVLIIGLTMVAGGLQGLVLPLHFSIIERPEILGLVLTTLALGMLLGAVIFSALATRVSRRLWLTVGFVVLTVGFVGMATLASLPVIFAAAFLVGVANALVGGVLGVVQVEKTPDHARGRVLSLQNTALLIAAPIGIGGAGIVAEMASPMAAGLAVAAVWVLALLVVLLTRSLYGLERERVAEHA